MKELLSSHVEITEQVSADSREDGQMSDRGTYDELLAEEIQSCTEVHEALNNSSHPCN